MTPNFHQIKNKIDEIDILELAENVINSDFSINFRKNSDSHIAYINSDGFKYLYLTLLHISP